jgi:hypothetical protein
VRFQKGQSGNTSDKPKGAKDRKSQDKARRNGETLLDPSVHAAVLAFTYRDTETEVSLLSMYDEIKRLSGLPPRARLAQIESTLTAQALALQAMFSCLAMRAEKSRLVDHFGLYAGLALKAQRQCRATLATLADIINPVPATFIKNNARNQQVNIGGTELPQLLKKNSRKSRNELLRSPPHAAMDESRTLATIPTDSPMASVVPIDRAKHTGRQGTGEPKRAKARSVQC